MNHSCGITLSTEEKFNDPVWRGIRRSSSWWTWEPEHFRSVCILLTTPGFPLVFLARNLRLHIATVSRIPRNIPNLLEDASDNLLSITRDDALVLRRLKGGNALPIVRRYIAEDIKRKRPYQVLAIEWGYPKARAIVDIAVGLRKRPIHPFEAPSIPPHAKLTGPWSLSQWYAINPRLREAYPDLFPEECPWLVYKRAHGCPEDMTWTRWKRLGRPGAKL